MNRILKISILVVICLIVILGIALIIGQCSKDPEETTTTPQQTTSSTTSSTTGNGGEDDPTCTEHVDNNTDYICDNCGEELERPSDFIETNDKIYIIAQNQLNLRKNPGDTSTATVSVITNTELDRIGYYATGENEGWSKVLYEGEEYYVATDYVTTQKPITDDDFTEVEETVYVIEGINPLVFSRPSHIEKHQYSEQIGTLFAGNSYTRLGVATVVYVDDEGNEYTFAKVRFEQEGEPTIGYVNNEYLTTDAPANPDAGVEFEESSDVLLVIADTSINLRTSAEYPAENIGAYAFNGDLLQATHKGTASNGRVWYKVLVGDKTYYVIFSEDLLQVQGSSSSNPAQTLFGEYNITLPTGVTFESIDSTSYMAIHDDDWVVTVVNTGNISDSSITAELFLEAFLIEMDFNDAEVQEKDGLCYFEYEDTYEGVTSYYLGILHEGNDSNFYLTLFIAEEDLISEFWTHIDTITITSEA